MSFLGRNFIFCCNFCVTTVSTKEYGLPKNWKYLRSTSETLHACEHCTKNFLTLGAKIDAKENNCLIVSQETLKSYSPIQ